MKPDTIALILGRKGSTGQPGNNSMEILGRPACTYPMLAAAHSKYVRRSWVSTDDQKIANVGMTLLQLR